MKILIAGSHGMIGSAVTPYLIECGHDVTRLVRQEPGVGEVWWGPDAGQIHPAGLEGFDGVVQLASGKWPMRWTAGAKKKMLANHLGTNRLLALSLAGCNRKPQVLICASGMGYYRSSGDEVLTEDCPTGTGWLASLQREGEAATHVASKAGIRVVHLRIPMVLGGERLAQSSFRAGDGQQWMSWVGRDELASIIEFVLRTPSLTGPINATSPNPMRAADFARVSAEALGQKRGSAMPAFVVRLGLGEMGEEFLLASRRMQPAKLLAAGYRFRFPDLADALCHEQAVMNRDATARVVA